MIYQTAIIATLFAAASAADISSTSKVGATLLSKARNLNDAEDDFSWMAKYDLKFDGCHTIHTYGAEGQDKEEGSSPFSTQHLAKFKLCSSDKSCGQCSGAGVYMVELREFAGSYLQAKQEAEENACATVEENCNCDYYYGDDQACLNQCYAKAGLDYCGEDEEEEFNIEEYMECAEAPFYYGNTQYYIGPTCSSNGKKVNLAVFTDASCTEKAPKKTYEKYMYGATLPYSSDALISTNCISCAGEVEEKDDDGAYYEAPEPTDTCTQLYEQSAKCEKNMSGKNKYTKDTGSCDYIHKIVPALEHVYYRKGSNAAAGFAVFFALTTAAAAGAAFFFYSKVARSTVNLSEKEGGNFA